mmetsp:Transcript_95223/g.308357  ORF Transcript_95223/g.308357 Transcript_95223/m.308357 type:complete len:203 (+) Transcript_95223:1407-2015(+)
MLLQLQALANLGHENSASVASAPHVITCGEDREAFSTMHGDCPAQASRNLVRAHDEGDLVRLAEGSSVLFDEAVPAPVIACAFPFACFRGIGPKQIEEDMAAQVRRCLHRGHEPVEAAEVVLDRNRPGLTRAIHRDAAVQHTETTSPRKGPENRGHDRKQRENNVAAQVPHSATCGKAKLALQFGTETEVNAALQILVVPSL